MFQVILEDKSKGPSIFYSTIFFSLFDFHMRAMLILNELVSHKLVEIAHCLVRFLVNLGFCSSSSLVKRISLGCEIHHVMALKIVFGRCNQISELDVS